jgi:hypothetical protein
MSVVCPTCGHELVAGHAPIEALASAPLEGLMRRIVDALATIYPRSMDMSALVDVVYANDPNGGPESAAGTIRTVIARMRRILPRYGWTIPANGGGLGSYGRYRLEPVREVES